MTCGFLTPLRMETLAPMRWLLLDDLAFLSARYRGVFVVPAGFQTDLASIPRPLWGLVPKVGAHDRAAVLHDAAYAHALLTERGRPVRAIKRVADALFDEAMRADGVPRVRRVLMAAAVRQFGDPDVHPLAAHARGVAEVVR